MAEVRDLAPLRDEAGQIVGYPTVERAAHRLPGQPAAGPVPPAVPPAAGAQPGLPLRLAVDRRAAVGRRDLRRDGRRR